MAAVVFILMVCIISFQAHISTPGLADSESDLTLVTVTVLDVNDNNPVFENPHPNPIVLREVSGLQRKP